MTLSAVAQATFGAVSLSLLPTAAYAVSVSSNDGSGTQNVSARLSNGATVTGDLRSTTGRTVYYSGKLVRNSCTDLNTGRYSTNTSSTSLVNRGGTMSATIAQLGLCQSVTGVKSRICEVNGFGFPDGCGSDSLRY